jgi:DNA mismatch repair ATPase MutS
MKAFLMYRDRDFDPAQVLSRKERASRAASAEEAAKLQQLLPWNAEALTQDLGLEVLFNAMAANDPFLFDVAKLALLSSVIDPDTIRYRQRIFADCLKNSSVVTELYSIAIEAIEKERKNYFSYFARYPSGILHRAVDVLQMFVAMLRKLRSIADQHARDFESDGFSRLFAVLSAELSDAYFAEIESHLRRLKFRTGVLVSAELGKGSKGENYILRSPNEDPRGWITRLLTERYPAYTFHLHPRDEAGAQALSALNDKGVNLVANALAQSTDHILSFFQMLRAELGFYIGSWHLHARLGEIGEPACVPVPATIGARTFASTGLYDVALALSMQRKVVGNNVKGDHKNLAIITGANTGGKSTFLRSVGQAFLMMQAGMFVAAEAFSAEICEGVFTHYKREEDASMESGKWDEELNRMSRLVDHLKPNALILCNESFASTNEREGSEIARQIVSALLLRQVKVFFVTHLYHFAHGFADQKLANVLFLRAERLPDGTRPFKLIEGEPLQTSYGEDLYDAIFSETRKGRDHRVA